MHIVEEICKQRVGPYNIYGMRYICLCAWSTLRATIDPDDPKKWPPHQPKAMLTTTKLNLNDVRRQTKTMLCHFSLLQCIDFIPIIVANCKFEIPQQVSSMSFILTQIIFEPTISCVQKQTYEIDDFFYIKWNIVCWIFVPKEY